MTMLLLRIHTADMEQEEEKLASAIYERGPAQVIMEAGPAIQFCVPAEWTDEQVIALAVEYDLGKAGRDIPAFRIRGDMGRSPCPERAGCVHVVLEA